VEKTSAESGVHGSMGKNSGAATAGGGRAAEGFIKREENLRERGGNESRTRKTKRGVSPACRV